VTESASAELQTKIAKVIGEAVTKSVDWDFTEKLLEPSLKYVQRCFAETLGEPDSGFYPYTKPDGLALSFSVADEDSEILGTGALSLFDILDRQWLDCERSQADMIFALEHTVQRLKDSFAQRHGIPCEPAMIEARCKERWPTLTYVGWKPGDE
jgi:hypothetical protein